VRRRLVDRMGRLLPARRLKTRDDVLPAGIRFVRHESRKFRTSGGAPGRPPRPMQAHDFHAVP
jgi:hypothetical protein